MHAHRSSNKICMLTAYMHADCNSIWRRKLSLAIATRAEASQKRPVASEDLNPVHVCIGHAHIHVTETFV